MSINQSTILKIARRATVGFLLAASAISAFAVLGDKEKNAKNHSLSNPVTSVAPKTLSLKSNYSFRGSQIINPVQSNQYINLNTVLTYQKGNNTYIVPLKKKIYITTNTAGFTINH